MEFSKRRRDWSVSEFPCQGSRYYWRNCKTFKISQMLIKRIVIIIVVCCGIAVVSCQCCSGGGGGGVVVRLRGTLHSPRYSDGGVRSPVEQRPPSWPDLNTPLTDRQLTQHWQDTKRSDLFYWKHFISYLPSHYYVSWIILSWRLNSCQISPGYCEKPLHLMSL